MHHNFHFLSLLVKELKPILLRKKLLACFSQDKDELILGFADASSEFYIKASVLPSFTGFYFTESFQRAKRNSVNLFNELLDKEVIDISVFDNERAFELVLEDNFVLVFKVFGNKSNIILFEQSKAIELFSDQFQEDLLLTRQSLHRPIDQSKSAYFVGQNHRTLFPTWGKITNAYFEKNASNDLEKNWQLICSIQEKLNQPPFYICEIEDKICLSLLAVGNILETHQDAIAAANAFWVYKSKIEQGNSLKSELIKEKNKQLKQIETYLLKCDKRIEELLEGPGNAEKADMLMAFMHQISSGKSEIELMSFYTQKLIKIKLNPTLSIQKNAESYYRKAKKEGFELEMIQKNMNAKIAQKARLEEEIKNIQNTENLRELKKLEPNNTTSKKPKPASELFKTYELDHFVIYVGRNSENNDLLTLKYSHKNDLWLHAKDVSGSHVVVKNIPGKPFPKNVLEFAAGLAAWFSKKRNDGLVNVAYTTKKYVRKIKGAPAGQVILDREETLLVPPLDPAKL